MRLLPNISWAAITVVVALASSSVHARAGGVGDGGGEQLTAESNPWRVGPAPFEYCIERAEDFPQPKAELSKLVAESFGDWQNFFQKQKMDGAFVGNIPESLKVSLPPSAHELPKCNDTKSQIRFLFGVTNPEVQRYKKQYAERVIGFAHRTNYNASTFQGSGVVWIAPHNSYEEHTGALKNTFPDWNWRASLKHQILHEIGHVFGMPHNSTWVMDSEVMHTQLWATLRQQVINRSKGESDPMVPMGTIETAFLAFDPLSGSTAISTCVSFLCVNAPAMPEVLQKALGISFPKDKRNPEVKVRFRLTPNPQDNSVNEPNTPNFKMAISIPSQGISKTLEIRPQVLRNDLVPRLYVSGAYSPDVVGLRRVYSGTFSAVVSGNGAVVPMMLTVEPLLIKASVYDSSSEAWVDWFVLSAPYIKDPSL